LGFLNYDKSGGFITSPDNFVMFTKRDKAEILDEVFLFIKNFFYKKLKLIESKDYA
jgi:hypothetical protein